MHSSSLALQATPVPSRTGAITWETRFGTLMLDPALAIDLPAALPGFPKIRRVGLVDLADPRFAPFKLLQNVDAAEPTFITLPMAPPEALIAAEDLRGALDANGLCESDCAILFLVARHADEKGNPVLTVNLRAPILVDLVRRAARQYVLPNGAYAIRHPITQGRPVEQPCD